MLAAPTVASDTCLLGRFDGVVLRQAQHDNGKCHPEALEGPGRSSRIGFKPLRSRGKCGIFGIVSGRRHIETREALQQCGASLF